MILIDHYIRCDGRNCSEAKNVMAWDSIPKVRAKLKRQGWSRLAGFDFCPHCAELYRAAQAGMNGLGKGWPKRVKPQTKWRPIFEVGAGSPVQPSDMPEIRRQKNAKVFKSLEEIQTAERKAQ